MTEAQDKKDAALGEREVEVAIQQMVTAKASFDTDELFYHFREEWKPETKFECKCNHRALTDDDYQVVLALKIETKVGEKVIYTVNVEQTGIFKIKGIEGETLEQVLDIFCPNTLLPYAREAIANLVLKSGFPPFHLGPIDFEAAHRKRKEEKKTIN